MLKKLVVPAILFFAVAFIISSCQRIDSSGYYIYNADNDTVKPIIKITVPINNDIYSYGEDIHVIGNVNDLENVKKSGKLKSFNYKIERLNKTDSSYIKTIYNNVPNIDGKDSYTITDKLIAPVDTNVIFCRLSAQATDYANKSVTDTIYFYIQ